jgi:hypothetical protein
LTLRKTLDELVTMVRDETRISSKTSRGIDHDEHIKQLIRRNYQQLAEKYDWEHLRVSHEHNVARVPMVDGTRFYTFPTALDETKIGRAWVRWGSVWDPVLYGIGYEEYSAYNPDPTAPQKGDPVMRWDFQAGDPLQFEVWPVPASSGTNETYAIAFDGMKKIEQLTDGKKKADLDDLLLVLFVSAEILAENKQKESAEVKAAAARDRLDSTKARMRDQKRITMGMGEVGARGRGWPQHPRYVR